MMRRIKLVVGVLVLLLVPVTVLAYELTDKVTLSGFLKNETAVRLDDLDKFMKIENTFQLATEYRITDRLHWFSIIREFYDSVFDAEADFRENRSRLSRTRGTDWLREFYFDFLSNKLDVRIGKQQVVWGTTIGIKILDIVNPEDLREFVLDNFADSRKPLWMLKVEYSPTINGTLQFLFMPDFEPNFVSPAGSPFTFRAVTLGAERVDSLRSLGYGVETRRKRPGQSFENSSFGLRWLDVVKGFEYSLNWLHGYEYSPTRQPVGARVPPIILLGPPGLPPLGSTLILESEHPQVEYFGASFSKSFTGGLLQGLTTRGEFVYIHNHENGFGTDSNQVGVETVDMWKAAWVLEKFIVTNWLFTFQFIQIGLERETEKGFRFLLGPTQGTLDQVENFLTLNVSTDFMNERLKPRMLVVYGDDNDWRLSVRTEYEITEDIFAAVGTNLFWGRSAHINGQFRDNDQIFFEIKYGF
jgi:hypothetical protein